MNDAAGALATTIAGPERAGLRLLWVKGRPTTVVGRAFQARRRTGLLLTKNL